MIALLGLPKRFWAKAISTTCYTKNRCIINKFHEKTTYELLKDKKPIVSYFHTFYSKCFIHNNEKSNLKVFDERVDKGLFMGYSTVSKAFRVLNKGIMVVEEFIHVVFDEGCINQDVEMLSKSLNELSV